MGGEGSPADKAGKWGWSGRGGVGVGRGEINWGKGEFEWGGDVEIGVVFKGALCPGGPGGGVGFWSVKGTYVAKIDAWKRISRNLRKVLVSAELMSAAREMRKPRITPE